MVRVRVLATAYAPNQMHTALDVRPNGYDGLCRSRSSTCAHMHMTLGGLEVIAQSRSPELKKQFSKPNAPDFTDTESCGFERCNSEYVNPDM